MPRTLDHLPAGKRAELAFVVEVLTAGFDEECSTRWAKHLKNGQILSIILYGSYARGDWVEDPVGRYFSDYDLLVVVADEKHADVLEFWGAAEKRLLAELSSGERLRTPVNFIVHSQAEVDDALARGRYFFMDIYGGRGELLSAPDAPDFAEPQPLAPDVALAETQAHYEDWIPSAAKALKGALIRRDQHPFSWLG
ncbi:Nucleotidyltransferase domain protein [compost metagenome]|jgi:predicted nucleotidyltransferase